MNILGFFFLFGFIEIVLTDLTVEISTGKIQGYTRTSPNNVTFYTFQGIPYAKPPLDNLRFQAPTPPDHWSGILETKKDGSRCYSVAKDTDDESEDCLFINVYTPVINSDDSNLPVMVFFYGGGFRDGASQYNVYGPDYLIEQGVLVVSLNYRVGPFGFLSTGDEIIPGNMGLKDQVFGLKWVQTNIKKFGGDPAKVTIFGQSAGAASVGLHILSRTSAGLFRAAIAESGSGISNWAYIPEPQPYGYELASKINKNVILNSSLELLNYLQSVSAKEIDVASTQTEIIDHPLPVIEVEYEGAFLTKSFIETLENGDINRVPLMTGFNSEEYISLGLDMQSLFQRAASYDTDLKKLVPYTMNIVNQTKQLEVGQKIKEIYLESNQQFQDNLGLAVAFNTESHFLNPVVRQAEIQSNYTDLFLYKFSYAGPMGPNLNISLPGAEKCTHSEELNYIFKRTQTTYDNSDLSQFPPSDILIHKRMLKLWTNFATYLHPTPAEDADLQNLIWPKVTPTNIRYLNIDTVLTIETDVKQGRYIKWRELFEKEALPPYVVM